MMLLSRETREGLQMAGTHAKLMATVAMQLNFAVCTLTELVPQLLGVPGVSFVLSERFCQDPLESYFGKQRYRGGWNDNPSVKQYLDNAASLCVQSSAALEPLRGNTAKRRSSANITMDNTPLPKRPRKSAK